MYSTNGPGVSNAASGVTKTVADPTAEYETMKPLWTRARAVCSGERFVKSVDIVLNRNFTNLLIPFSTKMSQQQYNFYRAEAELPGIVAQFAKMLVGGLLRKQPQLDLPEGVPEEAHDWIMNSFGQDDSSITAVLDLALWEELQTSRAWVHIDYPEVSEEEMASMLPEDIKKLKPYPVLWQAEAVVNTRVRTDKFGKTILDRVIVRTLEPKYGEEGAENEFHADYIDTVRVHELTTDGKYQIRIFQENTATNQVPVVQGRRRPITPKKTFEYVKTLYPKKNDESLTEIPAWPLNGSVDIAEPILQQIIDKEVHLYNKISRRNHLLYGAATYTPYVAGNMTDESFQGIVDAGLGSWLHLTDHEHKIDVLKTPTEALADYEAAIASAIEEMAKLGIRMLTPETDQSGVALDIRNAAQTAQLGTLNTKISDVMRQIICFMINWRYDLEIKPSDIKFTLSADFNPTPLGADWLRLATEWYTQGLIPREIWIQILKTNDMVPPEYDDEKGQEQITKDVELLNQKTNDQYASQIEAQQALSGGAPPTGKPKLKQVK